MGPHGEVLRYDTAAAFAAAASWAAFDPGANGVGADPDGYRGATFDGRYLYFVPYQNGSEYTGEVLRFDTDAAFTDPASWETYDASANGVGTEAVGYDGAVFDGRYVYFSPIANSTGSHGEVLRYDTAASFSAAASWSAFDPGANGVGADPDGYETPVFDGRYLYFSPNHNGTSRHGEVLRYDTQRAGQGSLRRFMEHSDAVGGVQTTNFELPTSDPGYVAGAHAYWSIQPVDELPAMSHQVVIDGYTQTGAIEGTTTFPTPPDMHLVVELSGALVPGLSHDPIVFAGGSSTVRGLVLNDWTGTGSSSIATSTFGANTVQGNIIGLDVTGTVPGMARYGVFAGAQTQIGGTGPGEGNVIAGTTNFPIYVGASSTVVEGNHIGVDITGDAVAGSSVYGVYVAAANNARIGGTAAGAGNLIGGATTGTYLNSGTGTVVEGNIIGTDRTGALDLGNVDGIATGSSGSPTATIGGAVAAASNTIVNSSADGITVKSDDADIAVLGNAISGNGNLAIDLDDDGVTLNDSDDNDPGPNNLLNFPVVASVTASSVSFDLDVPAGDYLVEAFRNPSGNDATGNGEAEVPLGTVQIAHGGTGIESFSGTFSGLLGGGDIALTATECTDGACSSFVRTSELSVNATPLPIVTVNSTGDGGDLSPGDDICSTGGTITGGDAECTLRAAIEEANAGSLETILFDIPTSDAGHSATTWTIEPASALPSINTAVAIDGTSQSGYVDQPIIGLDGSSAGAADGLEVYANDVSIRGLAIHDWGDDGVTTGHDGLVVTASWFGVDVTETPAANTTTDVLFYGTAADSIVGGSNPADGNRLAGGGSNDAIVIANAASSITIESNVFGMSTDGTSYGATGETIVLADSVSDVTIRDNRFGNIPNAVIVHATSGDGTTVAGNTFGIAEDGSAVPFGQALYSSGTGSLAIGGASGADGNVILGAMWDAIVVVHDDITATVLGNEITGSGSRAFDIADDDVTFNDPDDTDTGPNDELNFPVLGDVSAGEESLGLSLDVPAGDYRIELFANPTEGADSSNHGEGERLLHAETITHGGSGPEGFTLTGLPPLTAGEVLTATATQDLGGGSYGATSEFSLAITVGSDTVTDRSDRRHDLFPHGGADISAAGSGIVGDGIDLSGGAERLTGPNFDPDPDELTVSAWVNASSLSGESAVVAKTSAKGVIHELVADGGANEAIGRIRVGATVIEASGGVLVPGTWHQLAVAYDGADVILYVDGTEVDRTAVVGSIHDDRTIPVTIGNRDLADAGLNGSVDHVAIASVTRTAGWLETDYRNLTDPAGMISIGAAQTAAAGSWSTDTSVVRSGSHALDAPDAGGGADPWAVVTGLDEPGLAFESWWYLTSPSTSSVAAGTNTGLAPTDQRETRATGAGVDLAAIVGATRTVDATDPATIPVSTWIQVEIRTDETGTSSVWIDGVQVIAPTTHATGTTGGSAGLRVVTLPGGQRWYVDDVTLRRLVSDEPVTSLGPLHRQ